MLIARWSAGAWRHRVWSSLRLAAARPRAGQQPLPTAGRVRTGLAGSTERTRGRRCCGEGLTGFSGPRGRAVIAQNARRRAQQADASGVVNLASLLPAVTGPKLFKKHPTESPQAVGWRGLVCSRLRSKASRRSPRTGKLAGASLRGDGPRQHAGTCRPRDSVLRAARSAAVILAAGWRGRFGSRRRKPRQRHRRRLAAYRGPAGLAVTPRSASRAVGAIWPGISSDPTKARPDALHIGQAARVPVAARADQADNGLRPRPRRTTRRQPLAAGVSHQTVFCWQLELVGDAASTPSAFRTYAGPGSWLLLHGPGRLRDEGSSEAWLAVRLRQGTSISSQEAGRRAPKTKGS